jgi:shikimate dehydrogenase
MMDAAFRAAGMEGSYGARDVPPPLDRSTLDALRAENVHGASVTVPHKESALALADEASEDARAIGAANVLLRAGSGWRADNTDGSGFLEWIASIPAARARVQSAVVLGAGGSARAIVWALLQAGAERVRIVNRTRARARALAEAYAGRVFVAEPDEIPRDALLVHCTSLGLRAGDPLAVATPVLARAGCVLDLVYPETALVRAARAEGIPAEDGLGLLVAQGAIAFARWTGRDPDREAMHRGVLAELGRRGESRRS